MSRGEEGEAAVKVEPRTGGAHRGRDRKWGPGAAMVPDRREEGSATVLAVGVVAALVVSAAAFAAVGQAAAARHRAQGAADAAALAGASRVLLGDGEACAAAAELVADNGAELESCQVHDVEVTVRVTEDPVGVPAAFGPARAVARAGPVTAE